MASLVEELPGSDANQNERIENSMNQLLEVLKTPSYDVQHAVSASLQHLITKPILNAKAQQYIDALLKTLTNSPSYAERKGASLGIAALVKGLSVTSVAKYGIMNQLVQAVTNMKSSIAREGALLAYTQLFITLGTLFEAYVVNVLPYLLERFSDDDPKVWK